MDIHLIGVLLLAAIFVLGTLRPVNIGVLAFIATFVLGILIGGQPIKEVLAGFPADIFLLLVGVTFLFGVATVNGTIDWLIDRAARLIGPRRGWIPLIIFLTSAIPTNAGALGPAGIALVAPLNTRLAYRYRLDGRMAALLICTGSATGNFAPLNGLTQIALGQAQRAKLDFDPTTLWLGNLGYNVVLGLLVFLIFGGLKLIGTRLDEAALAEAREHQPGRIAPHQIATLVVLVAVAGSALATPANIGFYGLVGAALLMLIFPTSSKGADKQISWGIILLICGVANYVALLQANGTFKVAGDAIKSLGSPALVVILLLFTAGLVSAFASSAGVLGVFIPLAGPLLGAGTMNSTGLLTAVSINTLVVDSTPFSPTGAISLAAASEEWRPRVYRTMLIYGSAMVLTTPLVCFAVFVLPGMLAR